MRLLVLTDYYRDEPRNGSEVFCAALVDLLREVHHVDVLARADAAGSARRPRFAVDDATANDPAALAAFLRAHVHLSDYDLVYNLGALIFGCNVVRALGAGGDGVPLVNHFQALLGPYAREEGLLASVQRMNAAGQQEAAGRAAMNLFLSQAELLMARDFGYPLSGGITAVVPNGLPPEEMDATLPDPWFLPEERRGAGRPLVVATAGRFADFTKGADLVYRAFTELFRDRQDVFLVSVGNAHRFGHLLAHLPGDAYRLVDWLPRRRFLATLAAADLVVVPSRYEPFGLIAVEAQMLGVPVLANAVGGLAEIVHHGVSGMLNLPHDGSLGLYLAMRTLLEDPARLGAMGSAGRELARREYTLERVAAAVDKHLRRALLAGGMAAPALAVA